MSVLGNNFKCCVTCAYYEGRRRPKNSFVEFDSGCKGKCYKTFPQGVPRDPRTSCSQWEIWPPIKR